MFDVHTWENILKFDIGDWKICKSGRLAKCNLSEVMAGKIAELKVELLIEYIFLRYNLGQEHSAEVENIWWCVFLVN